MLLVAFALCAFTIQVCGNKTFLSKTFAKDLVTTDLYIGGTIVL